MIILGFNVWFLVVAITLLLLVFFNFEDNYNEVQHYVPIAGLVLFLIASYAWGVFTWNATKFLFGQGLLSLLANVGLYLVAGLLWSFFKWYNLLRKQKEKYIKELNAYNSVPAIKLDSDIEILKKRYMPTIADNKSDIFGWILYWPISVLRYVLLRMTTELINNIIFLFKTLYEYMAKKVFDI